MEMWNIHLDKISPLAPLPTAKGHVATFRPGNYCRNYSDLFCKVDAEARLFFHEKVAASRPRARLGASTDPIKKTGRESTVVLNSGYRLGSSGAAAYLNRAIKCETQTA